MENYYYRQKCKKCCSLQSVAIIYNYNFKLSKNYRLDEYSLIKYYPELKELINRSQGIGIENLAYFISDLFDTDVYIYSPLSFNLSSSGKSTIYTEPINFNLFKKNINSKYVIIYYNRHYSPILKYNKRNSTVIIGKNRTHELIEININDLFPLIDSYLSFNRLKT